jgi:hypothetical protein
VGGASGGTLPKGGNGGTETTLPGLGGSATGSNHAGGGGGGTGVARVNTKVGAFSPTAGGAMRTIYTVGTATPRQVP